MDGICQHKRIKIPRETESRVWDSRTGNGELYSCLSRVHAKDY